MKALFTKPRRHRLANVVLRQRPGHSRRKVYNAQNWHFGNLRVGRVVNPESEQFSFLIAAFEGATATMQSKTINRSPTAVQAWYSVFLVLFGGIALHALQPRPGWRLVFDL
jgi:hypothetical protein